MTSNRNTNKYMYKSEIKLNVSHVLLFINLRYLSCEFSSKKTKWKNNFCYHYYDSSKQYVQGKVSRVIIMRFQVSQSNCQTLDAHWASASHRPAPSRVLSQSQARLRITSAHQPVSVPPPLHDVTPSLKVQWRYWTITAISSRGPHLYYVANAEEKPSSRPPNHIQQRASSGRAGPVIQTGCTPWQCR